nr:type III pantothenate kinase [bacterium]
DPGFASSLSARLRQGAPIDRALLASVCPPREPPVVGAVRRELGLPCPKLTFRTDTGMRFGCRFPSRVGADRIANAVGVHTLYGAPALVVDFGTAVTVDAVGAGFEYLGGVIAPGLGISTAALFREAALLPEVRLRKPRRVLGRDTVSAIRSGVYWGTLGAVETLIGKLLRELGWGGETRLVATGGHARFILGEEPSLPFVVDPLLTLKGLRIILER